MNYSVIQYHNDPMWTVETTQGRMVARCPQERDANRIVAALDLAEAAYHVILALDRLPLPPPLPLETQRSIAEKWQDGSKV